MIFVKAIQYWNGIEKCCETCIEYKDMKNYIECTTRKVCDYYNIWKWDGKHYGRKDKSE